MRNIRVAATAGLLSFLPLGAIAETPQDTYWGELSYFYPTIRSNARLDNVNTGRPGTSVTLEDDLDLDDRKGAPYLTLGMRIGQSWRIEFEYFQINRSSSRTLARDIDWGDTTYPLGAVIDSTFDTTVYRLTGGYSFYRTPDAEAGGALGLHVTEFSTALSGQGTGPGGLGVRREGNDTLVPLPTLGLYGSWRLYGPLHLRGRIDYLSLKYNEYDGSLVNSFISLDWRFAKNWGAGFGYRYVDYKLDATSSDWHGSINFKFRGPTLFVNAGF